MRARLVAVLADVAVSTAVVSDPAAAVTGDGSTGAGRVCASYLTHSSFSEISSQNFEPEFDAYDAVAADDLQVTRKCRARVLFVDGWYGAGTGPADSETVALYRDSGGRPGRVIRSDTVVGDDAQGVFELTLDRAVLLRPGRTYWVSVQINLDFASGLGLWRWLGRSVTDGSPAVWMNPGDGFASGCIDWTPLADCRPDRPEGDLLFEVRTR